MPGPARRSRRTRNEPPEIGLPKANDGEHQSQDAPTQEPKEDENHKEDPEERNEESDEEGRSHNQEKQRSRKRDESPRKSVVAASTRRSKRVRKPTSRSSSRVSSPAHPGIKAKARGRATTQSDDQQSKDTDETHSGHASAIDEAISSSSSSSSSEDEDDDKSKHSQGTAPRRQPRRSKRARLYPTPDDPSQSEEKGDQETMDKKDKSRGDESCASSSSERKKPDVNNNDADDDSSDNEPLSILMKRKKEKLKKISASTFETSSRDSAEGNDHSHEAPPKRPLSSAASSIVDEDEDDKESGEDTVKPLNNSKTKQRRKRQATTTTATKIDTSNRSSGDELDPNGPPLKKKRGRKMQSSKKSVSDPSTNDELSSDESVVKGGQRSTRSRRRKENASRALPSTIQEQDENDDDHDKSTHLDERKIMEEKEESNDTTKPVDSNHMQDDDDDDKTGKKRSESKRTTRQRSDSHADDEASEEMVGSAESSRRSQRKRRKPRKLGGGESSDEDNGVIKEQTATDTDMVKEEDSQEVASEAQQIDVGLEPVESQMKPLRQVENADVDTQTTTTDAEDGTEEQSSKIESSKGAIEHQADDNIQIDTAVTAETTDVNQDDMGTAAVDREPVIGSAATSENSHNPTEKDKQIESVSAVNVDGECEDSQGIKGIPEQSATEIKPTSETTVNVEVSGAELSTQTETLSDVANKDSFQEHDKSSMDSTEATNSYNKQGLDHNRDEHSVLPPASPLSTGEHHQIASHESSTVARSQSAEGETITVSEEIGDRGHQTVNATASIAEGQPQSSESLTLSIEKSGQIHETAKKIKGDVVTVNDEREANPDIRNQGDNELINLSSNIETLSNENRGVELESSSLRNGEDHEHKNDGDAVDLADDSKTLVDADQDMDSPATSVSPSEEHVDKNDMHITVDDSVVRADEAIEEVKVVPVGEEMIESTPESEVQATKSPRKGEDEENDHFHDAQMELPPESHMPPNLVPTEGESAGKKVPHYQPTVVEESLAKESEPTTQVTESTKTENEILEERKQEAHCTVPLETPADTEGLPKEEQPADELSTPLSAAEVPQVGEVVALPSLPHVASSLHNTYSAAGNDFSTIPNKEIIDAGPQMTQAVSEQVIDGSNNNSCAKPSVDGLDMSIMPTNNSERVQEETVETELSLLQSKPLSSDREPAHDELKAREEAISEENCPKDAGTAVAECSDQDGPPKSVTYPQASGDTEEASSKPTISSDSNEPPLRPKMHGNDASAPAASPDFPVEESFAEPDGSTSEAKLPTFQALATDGIPNSSTDVRSTPELWALPFDLDYKVKFGPSISPASKRPNLNRANRMDCLDANKIKRVKAAIYAAGSKAHRGAGFERIFAEYWDAMALRLSDRLSSHTSDRCQQAIDNFLTTSKLRKLHNRFVVSILRRATNSMAVYDDISSHLPSKWRNRVSIICDKTSQPPTEQLNASDLPAGCTYEPMEPAYREAWHQDQPDPKPIGNESRRQKTVLGPKHEVASCSLPGALTVDPLVRKIAEECDMQVSELAVWMMVVAVREHATNVLRAALSQKDGMEQQELVPRTLRFPNYLANATKPPPKKDSNQELGKPHTAEKAARAQRKLTVMDIYAGSSTMPCGNVGSLGGSLSRDVLERSLHAAFDHLPVVPKDDFVQVQHFITEQIFGEARTRKVPTKPRDDERETRVDDVHRNLNVAMKQRNSFAVPAPAPAPTRQPQAEPQPAVKAEASQQAITIEVKESTQQDLVTPNPDASTDDNSGQKSLPRGMGRGAKDLAALMRRTSTSTPPVQENVLKENDGTVGGGETSTTAMPEETSALDSEDAPPQEESGVDGEDPMGQRRGKGFGIKNLAAMRARAGNNDPQPANNVS